MNTTIRDLEHATPERPATFFANLVGWMDKYSKLRKFFATRRSVIRGEKLFDESSGALAKLNLMGPLSFHVYESVLAGLPAVVLVWFVGALFPIEPAEPQIPDNASEFVKAWLTQVNSLAPSAAKSLDPFLPPLILLFVAWVAAWACLKRRDSTKQTRRRCRDAFLYFDGAYGLLPEALFSVPVALTLVAIQHGWYATTFIVTIIAFACTGLGYWIYLTYHKFPRLLFALNGYELKVYRFGHRNIPETAPHGQNLPWQ